MLVKALHLDSVRSRGAAGATLVCVALLAGTGVADASPGVLPAASRAATGTAGQATGAASAATGTAVAPAAPLAAASGQTTPAAAVAPGVAQQGAPQPSATQPNAAPSSIASPSGVVPATQVVPPATVPVEGPELSVSPAPTASALHAASVATTATPVVDGAVNRAASVSTGAVDRSTEVVDRSTEVADGGVTAVSRTIQPVTGTSTVQSLNGLASGTVADTVGRVETDTDTVGRVETDTDTVGRVETDTASRVGAAVATARALASSSPVVPARVSLPGSSPSRSGGGRPSTPSGRASNAALGQAAGTSASGVANGPTPLARTASRSPGGAEAAAGGGGRRGQTATGVAAPRVGRSGLGVVASGLAVAAAVSAGTTLRGGAAGSDARFASGGGAPVLAAPWALQGTPGGISSGGTAGSGSSSPAPGGSEAPAPTPGGAFGGTAGSSSGFGSVIFLAIAGLLAWGAPLALRRLRLASESQRPAPFVLIADRPG